MKTNNTGIRTQGENFVKISSDENMLRHHENMRPSHENMRPNHENIGPNHDRVRDKDVKILRPKDHKIQEHWNQKPSPTSNSFCVTLIKIFSIFLIIVTLPFSLLFCLRVVQVRISPVGIKDVKHILIINNLYFFRNTNEPSFSDWVKSPRVGLSVQDYSSLSRAWIK